MTLNILELRALRGPNRYSRYKTIFMVLDIGEYEEKPSDKIFGFTDRLIKLVPSLKEHKCSIGEKGGFIQRLHRGTWVGHVIEHVAIELQCLAGMDVAFGKTYDTEQKGIYIVVFRYQVESVGLQVAKDAVTLIEDVIQNKNCNVSTLVQKLKKLREEDQLGPSTQSIVAEASLRGIPYTRLNQDSFVQLGYGKYQKKIQASMTSETSALAAEIADEKYRTKNILNRSGIPVPQGGIVTSIEEAELYAKELGYPVVVKPEIGNHGRGISININSPDELVLAFQSAQDIYHDVLIEQYLEGNDYRILVIDGNVVAAAYREPPHVTGDGISTIQQLIDNVNNDPLRGYGHENILTKIDVDMMTLRLLERADLQLSDILSKGKNLYIKSTANLSQGGTAVDVTDEIHPEIRFIAERTAKIIGLDCVGIDLIAKDISKSLNQQKVGIVEVNAAPGFRMHLQPSKGSPQNVAKHFVDMLFCPDSSFNLPIIAVTGTNGKTTTCRLIAHALKHGGKKVGYSGTTGVEFDGISVLEGDYSGPEGHRIVLSEPTVDHAVLETARGGIIRRGLAFQNCEVGVLLNINNDHLGNDFVETIEDLALVKFTVVEVVKENGTSVLNADDEIIMSMRDRARGQQILFSIEPNNPYIQKHLEDGGTAVVLVENEILIKTEFYDTKIASHTEVPLTYGGSALFNTANVLAAVGALYGLGVNEEMIRNGILTFHPSIYQNPGRMNLIDFNTFKVMIDYGHNEPAINALAKVLPKLTQGKKTVVCHGTGNRTNDSIKQLGITLANVYDYVIISDVDNRQRKKGVTASLVREGLQENGFDGQCIQIIPDIYNAIDHAFERVSPGELIVIQVDEVQTVIDFVLAKLESKNIRPTSSNLV